MNFVAFWVPEPPDLVALITHNIALHRAGIKLRFRLVGAMEVAPGRGSPFPEMVDIGRKSEPRTFWVAVVGGPHIQGMALVDRNA